MIKQDGKFIYCTYSDFSSFQRDIRKEELKLFLRSLVKEYPNFSNWFEGLFLEAGKLKSDREIIVVLDNERIVAASILKKTAEEKKICTFRVSEKYQRQGIGRNLMQMSLSHLQCDKPLITVRNSKYEEFKSLFEYFGFELEQKNFSYYKLLSSELAFNGELPTKIKLIKPLQFLNFENTSFDIWLKPSGTEHEQYCVRLINWYEKIRYA
ncbi:MAG: GNAT family N-acetyltransferase [Anaerovoracaceae bacterium]